MEYIEINIIKLVKKFHQKKENELFHPLSYLVVFSFKKICVAKHHKYRLNDYKKICF